MFVLQLSNFYTNSIIIKWSAIYNPFHNDSSRLSMCYIETLKIVYSIKYPKLLSQIVAHSLNNSLLRTQN